MDSPPIHLGTGWSLDTYSLTIPPDLVWTFFSRIKLKWDGGVILSLIIIIIIIIIVVIIVIIIVIIIIFIIIFIIIIVIDFFFIY